jgi:hypothetical protein
MARPDPRLVRKQPVATAPVRAGEIAISPSRAVPEARPLRLFAADGRLDLDAVWRLIDHASVIVEGRIYEAAAVAGGKGDLPVFLGSALMSVDLAAVGLDTAPGESRVDAAFTQRVRDALARDRRTQPILRDRAAREAARLLGPETPGQLEATSTLRARGTTLLIDLDLEGAVEGAAH